MGAIVPTSTTSTGNRQSNYLHHREWYVRIRHDFDGHVSLSPHRTAITQGSKHPITVLAVPLALLPFLWNADIKKQKKNRKEIIMLLLPYNHLHFQFIPAPCRGSVDYGHQFGSRGGHFYALARDRTQTWHPRKQKREIQKIVIVATTKSYFLYAGGLKGCQSVYLWGGAAWSICNLGASVVIKLLTSTTSICRQRHFTMASQT